MVGKTLGHYEILEPLGAGGMGEVYRARDATLKRDVAVKVLSEEFAADSDRLARLEREAHLLASLNHPNIATIHSLERDGETRFLVLELVKGESLEQLLAGGPLTVERSIEVVGKSRRLSKLPTARASFIAISNRRTCSSRPTVASRSSISASPRLWRATPRRRRPR